MSIPYNGEQPSAIDVSHHLSELGKARKPSPLKGLQKYIVKPGMIMLEGGMPDPSYFPFESITVDALIPGFSQQTKLAKPSSFIEWFRSFFGTGPPQKTQQYSVPKYPTKPDDINLAKALQYADVQGISQLKEFVHEFTAKVHRPIYSDWATLVDFGNTDGIIKSIMTLCNPGERLLVEEWTYASMLAAIQPWNVLPAPVKVDGEGLSSIDLERVLSGWDEAASGAKRPHVLYTIPIGQNPTGATMGLERKKAIYAVCVKFDVIIIEDDPYFFLQEGVWLPKSERDKPSSWGLEKLNIAPRYMDEQTRFIESLTPSFLRVDYQGRVIRLDSFSKIIAPGSRLGWITSNPKFIERLERQGETTTLTPCGLAQALITQLITKHWGLDNFFVWIQSLQKEYTARRDFFVDGIFEEFDVHPDYDATVVARFGEGVRDYVYTAYPRRTARSTLRGNTTTEKGVERRGPKLFSFVPPSSGMFVWLSFHLRDLTPRDETLSQHIWEDLAENGLLLAPGWMFNGASPVEPSEDEEIRYRVSFSMGDREVLKKGLRILANVLDKYCDNLGHRY